MLYPNPLIALLSSLYFHLVKKGRIHFTEEVKGYDNCDNANGEHTEE